MCRPLRARLSELIEARGTTLLYLPPYSPDLNPIELMFAKLKHLLRSAAARFIDRLWTVLGDCLKYFAPANAPAICAIADTATRLEKRLERCGRLRPLLK